jgi:hypothetical protein
MNIDTTEKYKIFIIDIKSKITLSQIKIASTVNSALLTFYWELGEMILFYIKKLYEFYYADLVQLSGGLNQNNGRNQIVQRRVGQIDNIISQIPWRHNLQKRI